MTLEALILFLSLLLLPPPQLPPSPFPPNAKKLQCERRLRPDTPPSSKASWEMQFSPDSGRTPIASHPSVLPSNGQG